MKRSMIRRMSPGLQKIWRKRGLKRKIALTVGISEPAVGQWRRVPAERVLEVERITGIARSELRPDLYPQEN